MRAYRGRSRVTACSTAAAIRSGRLCSSGGSGCTSTGHARRAATSATWRAMAPHATTAVRTSPGRTRDSPGGTRNSPGSGREGEAVDEAVVEVGAIGELDVVHLLQERLRRGPLAQRQER